MTSDRLEIIHALMENEEERYKDVFYDDEIYHIRKLPLIRYSNVMTLLTGFEKRETPEDKRDEFYADHLVAVIIYGLVDDNHQSLFTDNDSDWIKGNIDTAKMRFLVDEILDFSTSKKK